MTGMPLSTRKGKAISTHPRIPAAKPLNPSEKTQGIDSLHIAADEGDWEKTVPETVYMLQTYLKTNLF